MEGKQAAVLVLIALVAFSGAPSRATGCWLAGSRVYYAAGIGVSGCRGVGHGGEAQARVQGSVLHVGCARDGCCAPVLLRPGQNVRS